MNDDFRGDPEYIRACLFGDEPDDAPRFPENNRERLRDAIYQWLEAPAKGDEYKRTHVDVYPDMTKKVVRTLDDISSTELDYLKLLNELQELTGPWSDVEVQEGCIGGLHGVAMLTTSKEQPRVDDTNWPKQAEVARRLFPGTLYHGKNPAVAVERLIEKGELRTNGETGRKKRIDPASVLEY
jgi:hypothetical protein